MDVYATTTIGRVQWWIDPDAMEHWRSVLERLFENPDDVLHGSGSVARARAGRKRFYHVRPDGQQLGLFVKVFGRPQGIGGALRTLWSSRARREARVARAIAARGIHVAAPIAIGEQRRFRLLERSFSIIPELEAKDLRSLLSDPSLDVKRRRELLERFGTFTRRLHDAGIDQDDTSPNNFLVDTARRFVVIDFERCKVGAPLSPARRWQLLAKLQRHRLGVPMSDRVRFLRAYLGTHERDSLRHAWRSIAESFREVRRNDATRAARGAFQEGRLLRKSASAWQVRGRESAPVIHLDLPQREARKIWILAHQLERLGLPALRPVRLTREGVDLLQPGGGIAPKSDAAPPSARSIERARRELERYGVWKCAPEWEPGDAGPVLRNLEAFELRI